MKIPLQDAGRDAPTSRPAEVPRIAPPGTSIIQHSRLTRNPNGLQPIGMAVAQFIESMAQTAASRGELETAKALLQMTPEVGRGGEP